MDVKYILEFFENEYGTDPQSWPLPRKTHIPWLEWAKRLNAEAVRRGWNRNKWPWDEEDYHSLSCWVEDWLAGEEPEECAWRHHNNQTKQGGGELPAFNPHGSRAAHERWLEKFGSDDRAWSNPFGQALAWKDWEKSFIAHGRRRGWHQDHLKSDCMFDFWGNYWIFRHTPEEGADLAEKSFPVFSSIEDIIQQKIISQSDSTFSEAIKILAASGSESVIYKREKFLVVGLYCKVCGLQIEVDHRSITKEAPCGFYWLCSDCGSVDQDGWPDNNHALKRKILLKYGSGKTVIRGDFFFCRDICPNCGLRHNVKENTITKQTPDGLPSVCIETYGPDPTLAQQPTRQELTWSEWAKRLNAEAVKRGWNPIKWPWDEEDYHSLSCWVEDWAEGKTPEQTADENHQSQTTENKTPNYFPDAIEPTAQDCWIIEHGSNPAIWPLPDRQELAWAPWAAALIEEGSRRGFHPDFLVQEMIFDWWGLHWLHGLTPSGAADEMAEHGEIYA